MSAAEEVPHAVAPDLEKGSHFNHLIAPKWFRLAVHIDPAFEGDLREKFRLTDDAGGRAAPTAVVRSSDPPMVALDFRGISKERKYSLLFEGAQGPVRLFRDVPGSELWSWSLLDPGPATGLPSAGQPLTDTFALLEEGEPSSAEEATEIA